MCYASPRRTQRQCDDEFLHNMRQTCRQFPGIGSPFFAACMATARLAWGAVQRDGKIFPGFAAGQSQNVFGKPKRQ